MASLSRRLVCSGPVRRRTSSTGGAGGGQGPASLRRPAAKARTAGSRTGWTVSLASAPRSHRSPATRSRSSYRSPSTSISPATQARARPSSPGFHRSLRRARRWRITRTGAPGGPDSLPSQALMRTGRGSESNSSARAVSRDAARAMTHTSVVVFPRQTQRAHCVRTYSWFAVTCRDASTPYFSVNSPATLRHPATGQRKDKTHGGSVAAGTPKGPSAPRMADGPSGVVRARSSRSGHPGVRMPWPSRPRAWQRRRPEPGPAWRPRRTPRAASPWRRARRPRA